MLWKKTLTTQDKDKMKTYILTIAFVFLNILAYSQSAYTKPYQYRDPVPLDISSLGNSMTTKQNRYNDNTRRIQDTIDRISNKLDKMSKTDEQYNFLINIFTEKCVKKMPNIDYSSISQTDQLVNYLYDCINYQLENN